MTPKKKKLILLLLVFLSLLTFLLWPLQSIDLNILEDPIALKEKQNILSTLKANTDSSSPNILLITVDDLGMADVSLYGEGDVATPNIEKLGNQGVIFENTYVTSPVCAPSRASLITGRYQQRFGFEFTMHDRYLKNRLEYYGFKYFVNSYPWEPRWTPKVPTREGINQQGLPTSEISIADILKTQGYQTGVVGKWHLGWSEEKRPSAFGFDEQYGFFMSHSLYAPEGTPGILDQKIEGDWTDPFIWKGQRNGPHAIHKNYKVVEEKGYLTDRITDESIAFIENHKEEPYFLWASYNAPHTPLQAPQDYVDKFMHIEDPVRRVHLAMINKLDDEIGRLMKYLSDNGMDENTLVILISDNGGAEYNLTTDNGRYKGGKITDFEGGLKVPMVIRWTGTIAEQQRYEKIVSSIDILPTCVAAVNSKLEIDRPIDGVNLLPYLRDSAEGHPHDYLFWQRGHSNVIRSNDWKLMVNDQWGEKLLFDLNANKYEEKEVAANQPEVVKGLEKEFNAWLKIHREPLWPAVIYFNVKREGKKYKFEM